MLTCYDIYDEAMLLILYKYKAYWLCRLASHAAIVKYHKQSGQIHFIKLTSFKVQGLKQNRKIKMFAWKTYAQESIILCKKE